MEESNTNKKYNMVDNILKIIGFDMLIMGVLYFYLFFSGGKFMSEYYLNNINVYKIIREIIMTVSILNMICLGIICICYRKFNSLKLLSINFFILVGCCFL